MPSFSRFLLCAAILFALPLHALEVPVSVTATADNALDARDQAIEKGQRQAFYAALLKLAPSQARDIYRELRGKDVSAYVESFTVTREVQRATHYEADVIYRISEAQVAELIKQRQGIFAGEGADAAPTGNGLLVIPAYDAGGELLIFERENLWRGVMNNLAIEMGRGSLVMPFGDPRDIALLEDEVIITGNVDALKTMAQRYGTRHVVIALARARTQGEGGAPVVEVILRKAGAATEDEVVRQYQGRAGVETLDMVLARAARETARSLSDSSDGFSVFGTKKEDAIKPLVLRVKYGSGRQWRAALNMLEALPNLVSLDIGAVGVDAAEVTLFVKGSHALIQRAMNARGFSVDDSKQYWLIRATQAR